MLKVGTIVEATSLLFPVKGHCGLAARPVKPTCASSYPLPASWKREPEYLPYIQCNINWTIWFKIKRGPLTRPKGKKHENHAMSKYENIWLLFKLAQVLVNNNSRTFLGYWQEIRDFIGWKFYTLDAKAHHANSLHELNFVSVLQISQTRVR